MNQAYNPRQYWEQRLHDHFTLRGVGHISFSHSYNTWLYRRKQRCLASCLSSMSLEDKHVLDVGCGTGFFVEWYLKNRAQVCGIDITEVSIVQLKQKYPAEFYTQDITDPHFELMGRQFDIVNMWDVVYHIVEADCLHQAFDNIARSMKSGGLLLFTDWFGASSEQRIAKQVQARCLQTYNHMLPEKGFELVGLYPLYNHLNKIHLKIGKVNLPILDNYLGWLYFLLDNRSEKISTNNLSLGVWRYL